MPPITFDMCAFEISRMRALAALTAAVNAANTRMREISKQHMSKVMGGMNIPGMPGLPF